MGQVVGAAGLGSGCRVSWDGRGAGRMLLCLQRNQRQHDKQAGAPSKCIVAVIVMPSASCAGCGAASGVCCTLSCFPQYSSLATCPHHPAQLLLLQTPVPCPVPSSLFPVAPYPCAFAPPSPLHASQFNPPAAPAISARHKTCTLCYPLRRQHSPPSPLTHSPLPVQPTCCALHACQSKRRHLVRCRPC